MTVKSWPAEQTVSGSRPVEGKNISNRKHGSIAHHHTIVLISMESCNKDVKSLILRMDG